MRLIKFPSLLLLLVLLFNSCTEDLTFDNIALNPRPIFTSPIVFFTLDQNDFYDSDIGAEIPIVNPVFDFRLFENTSLTDRLLRFELNAEIDNQFDRDILIRISLLDENNQETISFGNASIGAGTNDYEFVRAINIANNPSFSSSTKIRVSVLLSSSANTIDPNIPREFNFKSFGVYYTEL